MASINGVELKNYRQINNPTFEFGSILTGTVYLCGKKLGEWSQDPRGAVCDNFTFDESLLKNAVMGVKSTKKPEDAKYYDESSFMLDLYILNEREKIYIKHLEKGIMKTPVVMFGIDERTGSEYNKPFPEGSRITDKRKEEFITAVAVALKKQGISLNPVDFKIDIYRSPDDFNQRLGDVSSIKKELDAEEKKRQEAKRKANEVKLKEEQEIKDRKKRNNGRFVPIKVDGMPYNEIKDTKTGRTVKVPLFAFSETLDAIIDLIC